VRAEQGRSEGLLRGASGIVLAGLVLGAGYNALGTRTGAGWGIPWIGKDRMTEMLEVPAAAPAPSGESGYGQNNDPMAVGAGAGSGLPEIPDLGRPVKIERDALKQLYDAHAVLLVDARDPDEYAQGHIPGAQSLPFDEVSSQPERLITLDSGGRPIVAYCGGGGCELSMTLAFDLIEAGHTRVAVYTGGFPQWEAAGYPVARGAAPGER
jgi:rhodanese-related sulfurtransferase